jgi:lipid-A-disaccharide synthase
VAGKSLRLGICAGETSGDILGAAVLRALSGQGYDLQIDGIGGERMLAAGLDTLRPIDRLAVMGLIEPLKRLPELLRIRRELVAQQRAKDPHCFVGVDSPDFNLGVEERLRAAGIPTAHLVSPSVWAWRKGRIRRIQRAVDKMLCLLPFEIKIYEDAGIDAVCVGHPLVDELQSMPTRDALRHEFGLPLDQTCLAVLPGSREAEVRHLMPTFLETMRLLQQCHRGLHFVIPAADASRRAEIEALLGDHREGVTVISGRGRDAMQASDAVLIASGTATLEAMLLRKPMVIAYRMAAASWMVLSRMVTSTHVGLPNILAGREIVPELLQQAATPERLAAAVGRVLETDAGQQIQWFGELADQIGGNFAARSAEALIELTGA